MRIEIKARKKWQFFSGADLKELLHYKDLLRMLVMRDINVLYKQTVLGFAWAILKPLFQAVMFTVVFGYLAGLKDKMQGDLPYIVFAFAGLVPWTYFSTAITGSTASLLSNTQFLTKVYFPRIIIPLTPILSKLVDFFVSFGALLILLLAYHIPLHASILYLPIIVILMVLATFSLGLWLSALAIQYRDIAQLMQFLVPVLMYAAPVILPVKTFLNIKPWITAIYGYYPLAGIVEGFRASIVGTPMPWDLIVKGSITTLVLLIGGVMYFRSKEDYFADVV